MSAIGWSYGVLSGFGLGVAMEVLVGSGVGLFAGAATALAVAAGFRRAARPDALG